MYGRKEAQTGKINKSETELLVGCVAIKRLKKSSYRSTRCISARKILMCGCADVYDRRIYISCTCMQTYILCTAVQMVTPELRYECITCCFLIDEYQITELFSGYIVNFVKHVRFTSPDMMLYQTALYAVHAWKKAF
ncbi:hypothetical protein TNCV_4313631 [Trichonephila clavipes]|nr:hypothetical protein TNCV_4313631 [Trichonephila clavipes]